MTPAIRFLEKQQCIFEIFTYQHEAGAASFANEAAEKLKLSPETVFKTLVLALDTGRFAVAILPATQQLSMKKLAKALGAKKAHMADAQKVQTITGYVLGGVSPFAQKKVLPVVLDSRANELDVIYVSGGKRGLEIKIAPQQLTDLLTAKLSDICA